MKKITQDKIILNIFYDNLNNGYIEDNEEVKKQNEKVNQHLKSFNRKFMFEKDLLMLSDDISDLNYYYHKQGFIDGFKVAMTLMGGEKKRMDKELFDKPEKEYEEGRKTFIE